MRKICSYCISILFTTTMYAQTQNNWESQFLEVNTIDTTATCQQVRTGLAELVSTYPLDNYYTAFCNYYFDEIEEREKNNSQIRIKARALAEREYENKMRIISTINKDQLNYYYRRVYDGFEPTDALYNIIPPVLEKMWVKWCKTFTMLYEGYIVSIGAPSMSRLSKTLKKEYKSHKNEIIEYFMTEKQSEAAETIRRDIVQIMFRDKVNDLLDNMPTINIEGCYYYCFNQCMEFISNIAPDQLNLFEPCYKKSTIPNPNYDAWGWLSHFNNEDREHVVTHYPIEDTYYIDHRHPEYIIRTDMEANTEEDWPVTTAYAGESLIGVAVDHIYSDIVEDFELILDLYELEHNKYNINSQPSYVKDCIRERMLIGLNSNNLRLSLYSGYEYTKRHKNETYNLANQYIEQLHLDRKKILEYEYDHIKYFRTERVDGTTFRHFIGLEEQIVILQKYVYGNYCHGLFPYSKITSFNPNDYKMKKRKVLTCYYIVEKYNL